MNRTGGMQETALERKQKLLALRNKYRPENNSPEGDSDDETDSNAKRARSSSPSQRALAEGNEEKPQIVFRNYKPTDQHLKELTVPEGRPERFDEQVRATLTKEAVYDPIKGIDLNTLAPKKPDWDLKRDVSKKMDKLERRTQKAIVHLIRDRLKGQEDKLAEAVSTVGHNRDRDAL